MWRDSRFFVLVLALVLALMAAACSDSDDATDGEPLTSAQCAEGEADCDDTIEPGDASLPTNPDASDDAPIEGVIGLGEALAFMGDDPIAVEGFVVIDAEGPRLCETLLESFPPQCGGAHLDIVNPDILTELPLVEEGDTQWTETYVTLVGDVNENEFTVTDVSF